jgi:hypothetical protein
MQPLQKPFARDKMPSQNQPAVVPARRASPITTIISIAAEIIEEYGKPIPLLRLMEELKKRGITIGGTNERINLASKLSTAKEVYFVIGRMVAYSPQAGLFR